MDSLTDTMLEMLKKCDILYKDELISRENLLHVYAEFLTTSFCRSEHNVRIVLHTSSKCFDIITILMSAISNLVFNETTPDEVIESLDIGDMVLYGEKKKSRYTFGGIRENPNSAYGNYAILKHAEKDITYVPIKLWKNIEPYHGNSRRMDGRGIRKGKNTRFDFIEKVFGFNATSISGIVDSSSVVVMPRDRVDSIINNTSILYDDNKIVRLLDIITASYFTERGEYRYGGNPGHTEPIIKITNNVSIARDLILSREGNKIIGLSVLGADSIEKGKTELPELINRRSLTYVIVACNIDARCAVSVLKEANNSKVFVCTKEFLKNNMGTITFESKLTKELHIQMNNIIKHSVEIMKISTNKSWSDYRDLKKALFFIRHSEISKEQKDAFLMYAYSLLNLFLTAVFSISCMEERIKQGLLSVESPQARIDKLYSVSELFPKIYREKAAFIIDQLEYLYLELFDSCPKEQELTQFLRANRTSRIALVLPKAYYVDIVLANSLQSIMQRSELLTVITPNRFDDTKSYDKILTVGSFSGKRFDTFKCRAATSVYALIYDFEANIFIFKMKAAQNEERLFNDRAYTPIENNGDYNDMFYDDSMLTDEAIKELESLEDELAEYVNCINQLAAIGEIMHASAGNTNATTEAIMLGTFLDGQKIFFTKAYKAYVFDSSAEVVNEETITNLSSGDTMIFTKNSSLTKDIVDEILRQLIENESVDSVIEDAYEKVKYWKEELRDYTVKNNCGYRDFSNKMKTMGVSRTEQAIRTWLDEDAHIVGPKDPEVFRSIGEIIEDDLLQNYYEEFCNACKNIRSIRYKILKLIGKTIINKLCGRLPDNNIMQRTVSANIDDLAILLQLDTIIDIKNIQVPINMVNHPISI